MRRRDLLAALPAAGIAGAIPAQAAAETPIMRLFKEWMSRWSDEATAYKMYPEDGAPELVAAIDRVREVEGRIFAEPATCLADMAIKLCVANGFGEWDMIYSDRLWPEARALVGA